MDSVFSGEGRSMGAFLRERWTEMCDGLGLPRNLSEPVTEQIQDLLRPWADLPVGQIIAVGTVMAG